MKNLSNMEVTSYAGSVTSIAGAMTSSDAGIMVGVVTALVTCAANVAYMYLKNRREQRESDARLGGGK